MGFLRGFQQCRLGIVLRRQRLAQRQRVGDFAESGLDGFLVFGKGDVTLGRGHAEAGAQAAALEDRDVDLRHETPESAVRLEQAGQFAADRADAGGQRDRREKRRACRANVGIGSQQPVLGGNHVGSTQQHSRWQAGRQGAETADARRERVGQKRRLQALPDQQVQGIRVLCDLAGKARHIRACGFDDGTGLVQHQRRRRAKLLAFLGQAQRLLVAVQRGFGNAQQLAVGTETQPAVGDLGNQRQLHAALR